MLHKVHCFWEKEMPPPSANFKNSTKNRVTQSVRIFAYKNCSANCRGFF